MRDCDNEDFADRDLQSNRDRKDTMKMNGLILSTLLVSTMPLLQAQDAAPPSVDLGSRKSAEVVPNPTPSATPNVPDAAQLDEVFRQSLLGKETDERRIHLEWRRLANEAANDQDIIAAKASVANARTDLEKRQRLRDYYNIYYGRMRAMAATAETKKALDSLKEEHLSHINQPRVRPETDGGLPTPSPGEKHKKK